MTGVISYQRQHAGRTATRAVQAAFADVVKLVEDEVRQKNQAEAYSNDILPESAAVRLSVFFKKQKPTRARLLLKQKVTRVALLR